MDTETTRAIVDEACNMSILDQLIHYLRIPANSRAFDPLWDEHGYFERFGIEPRHQSLACRF